MKKVELVGYNTHRLNSDDPYCLPEIIIVEEFHKWNGTDEAVIKGLELIIKPPNKKLSERDIKVAMSAIQWFATPCGLGFHETFRRRMVSELKANYKNKRTQEIQKRANDKLERINNAFIAIEQKTESDYEKFNSDVADVFKTQKLEISNIPDTY